MKVLIGDVEIIIFFMLMTAKLFLIVLANFFIIDLAIKASLVFKKKKKNSEKIKCEILISKKFLMELSQKKVMH